MRTDTPTLAIWLFGGIEVLVQGEPLPRLRSRQGLRLLALLALRAPRPLERRFLAGLLWPESSEEDGLALLRRTLTDLRKALGTEAERVASPSRHTLQLVEDAGLWRDTERLERVLAQEGALDEALNLYRGPLLEGFHDEWLIGEREHYHLLMLTALERRAQHAAPTEAIALLRRILLLDPLRETACRALLEALAAQGDTAGLTAAFRQFRRSLRRMLDTEPDDTTTLLYRRLLRTSAQLPQSPQATTATLPRPLTLFFGRGEECVRLQELLTNRQYRLLTLTGPGGAGKTRLATEVAHSAQKHFPGGVLFIALADLTEPRQALDVLAQALRVETGREEVVLAQVQKALSRSGQPMLLILDNLEQLLAHPDAPRLRQLLTDLLAGVPQLTCLTTSRLALRLSGEREMPVPPLALPEANAPLELLRACPSVALFQDRVQSLRPEWELTAQNAAQVVALCQELDGSPLALELAAGTLRILPLAQVLRRLGNRLDLMADRRHDVPERHRSLRTVLEGSYRLLPKPLQHFLADLSVFRGGWDLAAATRVCEGDDTLEALAALEEHSLLQLDPREEGRYFLQDVVREFAAERLGDQRRLRGAQERHASYFSAFAAEVSLGLLGPQQADWHAVMDRDYENVRAALDNLAAIPTEESIAHYLQLLTHLSRFWERRSYFREAYQRCLVGIQLHGERPPTELSARALMRMAVHCWRFGEWEQSRTYTYQALAYFEPRGYLTFQCDAEQQLGLLCHQEGKLLKTRQHFERGLALARQSGDQSRIASLLGNMAWVFLEEGSHDEALRYYEEQLALRRVLGDLGRAARSLSHLGAVALGQRDFVRARAYYQQSLPLHRQFKNESSVANDLCALGEIAWEQGEYHEAWQLCREAFTIDLRLELRSDALTDLHWLARAAQSKGQLLAALRLQTTLTAHQGRSLPHSETLRSRCEAAFGQAETQEALATGVTATLEETALWLATNTTVSLATVH